jgi:signal transduction histidine kinase
MESFTVLDNCPDASELVDYLHASAEVVRARLSRDLHDELGGLLVSAVMDVTFAEQALPIDDRLRQRLARARATLAAAIDLQRKTIETLRPSILDNFGLYEAIKWEVKQESRRTRLPCSEIYPAFEPAFSPHASIALFRVVQESLGVALRQPGVKAVHIVLDIKGDSLRVGVKHDGNTSDKMLAQDDIFATCAIAHRVRALGGQMTVTAIPAGGASYNATLPLSGLTTKPRAPGAKTEDIVSAR